MEKKTRVAAYCRVSTDMEDQLHSLASQIEYFTEHISQQEGWELVEVYYDEGITGTSVKKRDGFNRMIADCETGKIDTILTKEVSRFARNTVDTLNFTRKLSAMHVNVIFMNDGINTFDKDGELRLTIMASLAQEESRKISERVKWGNRRMMERGVVFGCGRVYGFRIVEGRLVVQPNEAEVVKRIFKMYLYERKGTPTIAKELNEDAVPTIHGKLWAATTILKILRNEKYVGDLTQWKFRTESHLTHRRVRNLGDHEDAPIITVTDHHEAIISRELWDQVQQELEERGRKTREGRKHSGRYWFSGKVSCGKCGKPFSITGNHSLPSRTLRCINRGRFGAEIRQDTNGDQLGCDNETVNEHVLARCVQTVLENLIETRDTLIAEMMDDIRTMQQSEPKHNTKPLGEEIEKLKLKKRKAMDMMFEDLISKEDLKEQIAYYDSEIARVTAEISGHQDTDLKHRRQMEQINRHIEKIRSLSDGDAEDITRYPELVEKVIVQENRTLDIYLQFVPFCFRVKYHVDKYPRINKYDIFVDMCEVIL